MKTVNQWFKKLPEPYSTMALENTKKDKPYTGNNKADSLIEAIFKGFLWESFEGGDFWLGIIDELKNEQP